MKEYQLYEPLRLGLKSLGLEVFGEVSLNYGSAIDCVALKNKKYIIGIELKRINSKSAIKQALRTKRYCHYSFIATPKMPSAKFKQKLIEYGIGFILLNYNIINESITHAKLDYIVAPKLVQPKRNLILHPFFKTQTGGVSLNNGPSRRTIFQQLTIDVEAFLKAKKDTAIHLKAVHKWVQSYCFGTVPFSKIVRVANLSPNLIMYKKYVMYFKNHIFLLPEEKMKIIHNAMRKNWNEH